MRSRAPSTDFRQVYLFQVNGCAGCYFPMIEYAVIQLACSIAYRVGLPAHFNGNRIGKISRVYLDQQTGQPMGHPRFDVVTARALAPLPKLLAWGLPLVAESGALLALKGASAQAEVEAARSELARRGARAEVLSSSVPGSSVTTVVRVVRDPRSAIGWQQPSARRRPRRRPQHQGKDLT